MVAFEIVKSILKIELFLATVMCCAVMNYITYLITCDLLDHPFGDISLTEQKYNRQTKKAAGVRVIPNFLLASWSSFYKIDSFVSVNFLTKSIHSKSILLKFLSIFSLLK